MIIKEKVLKALSRKWHTTESLNKEVGSVSGARRMRELRAAGVKIVAKKESAKSKKNMFKVETVAKAAPVAQPKAKVITKAEK